MPISANIMPRRMLRVAKNTSPNNEINAQMSNAMAATKQQAMVTLKLMDCICDKNKNITTAHTSKALNTLKLKAMCIKRDLFNKARSSVASDLLKSSSVFTFNLRSSKRALSVIRAKRFDKTPKVAAIPVIKNTGATAV